MRFLSLANGTSNKYCTSLQNPFLHFFRRKTLLLRYHDCKSRRSRIIQCVMWSMPAFTYHCTWRIFAFIYVRIQVAGQKIISFMNVGIYLYKILHNTSEMAQSNFSANRKINLSLQLYIKLDRCNSIYVVNNRANSMFGAFVLKECAIYQQTCFAK